MHRSLFLVVCAIALPIYAQTFPLGVIYKTVTDESNVITESDAAAIETMAKGLADETDFPLIVVTISSLAANQGDDMQSYAQALFAYWASTSERQNRGIVLLVSTGDRKVWIELGRYWGPYEDTAVHDIEQQVLIPAIKAQGYSPAIRRAVESLTRMARRDRKNDVRYLWFREMLYIALLGISLAGPIIVWLRSRSAGP